MQKKLGINIDDYKEIFKKEIIIDESWEAKEYETHGNILTHEGERKKREKKRKRKRILRR